MKDRFFASLRYAQNDNDFKFDDRGRGFALRLRRKANPLLSLD